MNKPWRMPEMKFATSYPLLAYSAPDASQKRVFLVNLAKNERQICIDLSATCYNFVDFFEPARVPLLSSRPEDL